jgi:hypothetical protein
MNFKDFYFDGNLYFGTVKSREEWELVKSYYLEHGIDVFNAKIKSGTDNQFGFYAEYDGDKSLRDFDKENNNQLTNFVE